MSSIPRPIPASPGGAVKASVLVLCFIAAAAALRRIVAPFLPAGSGSPIGGLDAEFAARKILTLTHIVPALLLVAILAAKVILCDRLGAERQRSLSAAVMLLGVIVGATALLMSFHPVGGPLEASAAISYDLLFLFALARAWVLQRRGDEQRYRVWMVRAVAVLLGIATTRPVMGVFFATHGITHLQPSQFFGIAFWIGFTITWAVGELYLRLHPGQRVR